MGRFYDAEKTNDYFKQLDREFDRYAGQAEMLNLVYHVFATSDDEVGKQADVTKELLGTGEAGMVNQMVEIHRQISDAGAHIRESFESDVDASPNALVEEDTLTQIEDSFKGFYKTYDDLGTQIEDIATILQSRFGEYATFERPDFEAGRDAFVDFCGGNLNGGYLQDCMERLEQFDMRGISYLGQIGVSDELSRMGALVNGTNATYAELDMSIPAIAEQNMKRIDRNPVGAVELANTKSNDEFDKLIEQICGMTKEEHYARNERNDISEAGGEEWMNRVLKDKNSGWRLLKPSESIYHTPDPYTTDIKDWNVKLVNVDGREVVLKTTDGYKVETDPRYLGTYNYVNPSEDSMLSDDSIEHFRVDVIPYIVWGNSEEDTSLPSERVRASELSMQYGSLLDNGDISNIAEYETELNEMLDNISRHDM